MNALSKSSGRHLSSEANPDTLLDISLDIDEKKPSASELTSSSLEDFSQGKVDSPSHHVSVVLLAVDSIDVGDSPNRLASSFDSDDFFLLAESILHNRGNSQPIVVRELSSDETPPDSPIRYRLISGARRLRACAIHQLPVLSMIQKTLPTRELVERLLENHLRQSLSPYELGLQLQHILDAGKGISRRELARLVGLDVSMIQKAIDIAALPAPVIDAFSTAAVIQYRDAKALKDAVAAAPDAVLACAEAMKGTQAPPKEVVLKLLAAAEASIAASSAGQGVERFNTPTQPVTMAVDGQPVGTMTIDKKGLIEVHLELPIHPRQQADLAELIEKFLRNKVLKPASRARAGKNAAKNGDAIATNVQAANVGHADVQERA